MQVDIVVEKELRVSHLDLKAARNRQNSATSQKEELSYTGQRLSIAGDLQSPPLQ